MDEVNKLWQTITSWRRY